MKTQILHTGVLADSKHLHLNETSCINRAGEPSSWVWAERTGQRNAVMIAAITDEGKLIVTKEFRVPLKDYEWGLPAGLLDEEEDILMCANRELIEETGYQINHVFGEPSPLTFSSAGLTNEGCYIVFCKAVKSPLGSNPENSEEIEVFKMAPSEIKALLLDSPNKKISSKAYLIFRRFAYHGDI